MEDQYNLQNSLYMSNDERSMIVNQIYDIGMGLIELMRINNCCNDNNPNNTNNTNNTTSKNINPVIIPSSNDSESVEFVDLENLFVLFNKTMEDLTKIYNKIIGIINNMTKYNLAYANHQPIVLDSYKMPPDENTIKIIVQLKNIAVNTYKKVIGIPDMIPKFELPEGIE